MKRLVLHIITILFLIASAAANASAFEQPGEYQVKALFLFNFINFIEWPTDSSFSSSPTINVCVMGDDLFDQALDAIRDETVMGKRMTIRICRPHDEPRGCHIVFISAAESSHTGHILHSIREPGVLTVADGEEAARQGAVIGFFVEQKKVRFAINIEAARQAGFKISAKLLKLAKIIRSTEH